ncbi:MAG TPA: rhomboid family intramembrane serine protease, partial [Thermomicrobiales bacterium]|nr:rhomboid family intramembrane serine protease [Thermomicrobiales bacterium]
SREERMIPIGDYAGQRRSFPFVNYALIALNVLVFLYEVSLPGGRLQQFILAWGAVPAAIVQGGGQQPAPLGGVTVTLPVYATILSSMFIHASWLHLGGNMLYLWVFGDNVEDACGHVRYLIFYFVCGIAASLAQIFVYPDSVVPTVGASGAIAGVMGAYLVMFPRARIRTLVILIFFITIVYLPAILVIGIWFLLQLSSGVGSLGVHTQQTGGVAVWAHVGGLVAGALLAFLFRRRSYHESAPSTYGSYRGFRG